MSYYKGRLDWSSFQLSWPAQNGIPAGNMPQVVTGSDYWAPYFRVFYSEAGVNFAAPPLSSSTALDVDDPKIISARGGAELATLITQLLVDISASDAEDVRRYAVAHPGQAIPETISNRRLGRFSNAFGQMFPTKRFRGIDRSDGRINVEFEDEGRVTTIEQLSTGEKQIVFRAGFLLQSLDAAQRSLVLIDEPELSLHPEWQERITQFYISLLSDSIGVHPQVFMATHSPFIVHGAPNAKPVILERQAGGVVREMPRPAYARVGDNAAVRAFNIDSFLNSAQKPLLILTEGETDRIIIDEAWSKLRPGQQRNFETKAALGKKNINITLNDQELFNKLNGRMILGLFDFDSAFNDWNGVWKGDFKEVSENEEDGLVKKRLNRSGWAMLLPVPPHRSTLATRQLGGDSLLSIEFLFKDSDIPPGFVGQKPLPLGLALPFFLDSKKHDFAAHVKSLSMDRFESFAPLFDRIDDLLNGLLV